VSEVLDRECDVFCRYLTGAEASEYVRERYRAAHERGVVEPEGGASAFDHALVSAARSGPLAARFADAHARFFAAGGLLRRKLVLLLALFEVREPERVDTVTHRSRVGFFAHAALLGVGFALMLLLSTLALLPVRIVCALGGKS
jgi:hypothetical protein